TATYSATQLALRIDQFVTPAGLLFRDSFSEALPWLTFAVIMWEFWGPFLLFFPFDRGQVRTVAVFGFTALHIGFGSMMELGLFAWIGAVTPWVLLPAWFWDGPARRLGGWADRRLGVGEERDADHPLFRYPREALFLLLVLYCFAWNLGNEKLRPNWLR